MCESEKALWRGVMWLWGILVVVCSLSGGVSAQEEKTVTRADLEKVASQSTVEITTIGRKSGKSHAKPIWFVYDQGHLYIQSGQEGKSDWYQNLKKDPQIKLKIGTLIFAGKAKFIEDEKETERIHALFRSKYLRARFANLIGSQVGHGKVVDVEIQ
ncbi:MAG: nitroreductase/quinone reductase family protein [Candidatus Binatia bacterium]